MAGAYENLADDYDWLFGDDVLSGGGAINPHLVFLFEDGGQIEPHEHVITFRPCPVGELRARLDLAGLTEVDTDFSDSADRYAIVARVT